MKLTRKQKKAIIKIAVIGLDIQNVSLILGVIGIGVSMFSKLFESDIFGIVFPATLVVGMIYCLSRIIFDGYIDMAEDIEEGRIK